MVELLFEKDIYSTRIVPRERELDDLFKRIDASKALLLDPYVMKKTDGKTVQKDVYNTKVNKAEILVNAIRDDLLGTVFQAVVEGDERDLPKTSKSYIERFINSVTAQIDEQLLKAFDVPLLEHLSFFVPAEGIVGGMVVIKIVNGKLILKYTHYDMRNVAWVASEDGLEWHSNREAWTKSEINKYFGKFDIKQDASCEVVDYWDDEWNRVFIAGKELEIDRKIDGVWYKFPQKHKFGSDPAVIACTSSGYLYKDANRLANSMQDALYLNKNLYEAMNRNATIVQTKAFEVIEPRYIQPIDGVVDNSPPSELPAPGKQAKRNIKEIPQLLVSPDMTPALQTAMADMNQQAQEGGYTAIDIGADLSNVNAIWITRVNELREKHLRTGKATIGNFYSQLWRKIIEQVRLLKVTENSDIKIGSTGKTIPYKQALLSDPATYSIRAKSMTRNRALEVANMSEFVATEGRLSLKYRLEQLLYVDDPEGEIRRIRLEKAEASDPATMWINLAWDYADEIDNLEGVEADKTEGLCLQALNNYKNVMTQQSNPMAGAGQPGNGVKGNVSPLAALAARTG